ncbi:MAG TPA: alpha-amylase/4-alpha-glucanotransferase domain-containing protein [Acidimicrobiia bacterium]|nr:alpha-amylase/4-alpha-glucanotransferase domain-containing protein [Acidimicrobiia bacterium]
MQLIFAVHCHQPFGQLETVLDQAIDRAYLPFLDVLQRHPGISVNVHYSGTLLEQLETSGPRLLEVLTGSGEQIEWMGGAMYEPILPAIPPRDRIEHLKRMRSAINERFSQDPVTAWVPERVWEPSLVETFAESGYDAIPLDDVHFERAGLEHLDRNYLVHYLDRLITAYPISVDLRYAAPREDPETLVESLRHLHEANPDAVAVLVDDGEKYGLWPGGSQRAYGPDGWLDRFFTAAEAADWVDLTTFERHLADHPATERTSLPPGSYQEMTDWSDGRWEHFLDRYPEADVLYRKMLNASKRASRDKAPAEALTEVLRGQGNDSYWHGVFGGLYLPHLRAETHRRLLASRMAVDEAKRSGRSWAKLEVLDWDADGRDEIHVELPDQSWVLDLDDGALAYYDDKPSMWMVPDVVAARAVGYDTDQSPVRTHRWMTTRTLPLDASPGSLASMDPDQLSQYPLETGEFEKGKGWVSVGSTSHHGRVRRLLRAENRSFDITYEIDDLPECRFGPEFPIAVWREAGSLRVDGGAWQAIDKPKAVSGHRFRFRHEHRMREILIALRQPGELFVLPLTTTIRNETGEEDLQQGILLWPHWIRPRSGLYRLTVEVLDVAQEPPVEPPTALEAGLE